MENSAIEKKGLLSYINDRKWYLLLFTLFWILMMFIRNPFSKSEGFIQEDIAYDSSVVEPVAGMIKDVLVEQHFVAEHNNLSNVQYTTATCDRENVGVLHVWLKDAKTGEIIAEDEKDVSQLPNMQLETLVFSNIEDSKGKEYILSFEADTEDGERCIILMGSTSDKLEPAIVNGNQVSLSLRCKFNYHDTGAFWYRILMFFIVYLVGLLLILLVRGTDPRSFLIFGSIVGLLYIFIVPFPHAIDESTHFFRSFMISQGNFVDDVNENGDIGGYVSDNYGSVIDESLNWESYINDREDWLQVFSGDMEFYRNPYMSSYIPVNHLPGAIGLWIGQHLKLPALYCILLGRFMTLVCYLSMVYIALKKANYYRNIYFVVSLIPMSVLLGSSFSADPLLIGGAMMVISICLKYRFDSNQMITIGELFLLLVGVGLIASSKYLIYLPILLLFFLIPKKCFSSKKLYILEIIFAVVIIIVFAIAAIWLLKQFNYVEDRNGHVDMKEQLSFLLNNKLTGFCYLVSGFFDRLSVNLTELGTAVPDAFPFALVVLTAVLTENPFEFEDGKKKVQICALFIGISFIIYACTVGALYLAYTPVGKASIDGVQARYMLPILPLMMMTLSFCLPAKAKVVNLDRKVALCSQMLVFGFLTQYIMHAFI